MLIDEIKTANVAAMKARDNNPRVVYSILISRYTEKLTDGSGKEIGDPEVVALIQKMKKELEEEKEAYAKAGRAEQAAAIGEQLAALDPFLPKQLSEEEIRSIIAGLEDKSIPSVMKHFKANYAGQVDMSLVNRLARGV